MACKVDPQLAAKVTKLGAGDLNKCYHCGTCTATCPLSEDGVSFPRKVLRNLQLGLKDRLIESPEPWLCYYCGDCSESCPQDAEPGETVMAARRFLTTLYDWTGFSYKFYSSKVWEFGSVIVVSLLVVLAFVLFHGPMVTELTDEGGVQLNSFAPVHVIKMFDDIMGITLSVLLISNAFHMFLRVMGKDLKTIPLKFYVTEVMALPIHFATQKRWKDCEDRGLWGRHIALVTGYVSMFVMIVVFLPWFQTEKIHAFWHPQRLIGYAATAALLYVTAYMVIGRIKKTRKMHKFSHSTDWLFLSLLFLTTLTGILVHILRINGFPIATYILYVIHMAVLVPMLIIEVPFGKWAHLAYRPLAIYFYRIKQKAKAAQA